MVRALSAFLTLALLVAAVGCNTTPIDPLDRLPAVAGTVTYRERIALTPLAVLEAELFALPPGGQLQVVGASALTNPGQVPIAFRIVYNPGRIQPSTAYYVRARIIDGNRVAFVTPEPVAVLTLGAPSEGLNLVLAPPPQR
jgi:putative lipoprotein